MSHFIVVLDAGSSDPVWGPEEMCDVLINEDGAEIVQLDPESFDPLWGFVKDAEVWEVEFPDEWEHLNDLRVLNKQPYNEWAFEQEH